MTHRIYIYEMKCDLSFKQTHTVYVVQPVQAMSGCVVWKRFNTLFSLAIFCFVSLLSCIRIPAGLFKKIHSCMMHVWWIRVRPWNCGCCGSQECKIAHLFDPILGLFVHISVIVLVYLWKFSDLWKWLGSIGLFDKI